LENILSVKPIGLVRSPIKEGAIRDRQLVSEIVIREDLSEGLEGLEEFSLLYVIFWMHEVKEKVALKVHPRGDPQTPLVGVFATRSPSRPNCVGLTLVRLLGRTGNVLKVRGLDAFDGSPVIDIKPFDPFDVEEYGELKVPSWWKRLNPEKWMQWQKLFG